MAWVVDIASKGVLPDSKSEDNGILPLPVDLNANHPLSVAAFHAHRHTGIYYLSA